MQHLNTIAQLTGSEHQQVLQMKPLMCTYSGIDIQPANEVSMKLSKRMKYVDDTVDLDEVILFQIDQGVLNDAKSTDHGPYCFPGDVSCVDLPRGRARLLWNCLGACRAHSATTPHGTRSNYCYQAI